MTLNTLADLHDDIRAHGVNREQGSGDKDWIKRPNTLPVLLVQLVSLPTSLEYTSPQTWEQSDFDT